MPRFIVRYRGEGPKPAEIVQKVRDLADAKIVDDSSPRMMLVDAPEPALRSILQPAQDWLVSEMREYSLPDRRPSVQRPPS